MIFSLEKKIFAKRTINGLPHAYTKSELPVDKVIVLNSLRGTFIFTLGRPQLIRPIYHLQCL